MAVRKVAFALALVGGCGDDAVDDPLDDPREVMRTEPSTAGCEADVASYRIVAGSDDQLVGARWYRWDDEAHGVEWTREDYGELVERYEATYEDDILMDQFVWVQGYFVQMTTTVIDDWMVLEQLYSYGEGPVDAPTIEGTDRLAILWSGGANVASVWDLGDDGVDDVAVTFDAGWQSPDEYRWTATEDWGIDGTVERAYGQASNGAYALTEEWTDEPVGGEYEESYVAEVDTDGRALSYERRTSGNLLERCTLTWDGRVETGRTCEDGDPAYVRTRLERVDGADGRVAEWRTWTTDPADGGAEALTGRETWTWSCP